MSKNRADMPIAPTACVPRPELKLLLRLVKGYAPAGTHPLPDNTLNPLEECTIMMPESLAQLERGHMYPTFSSAIPEVVDRGVDRGLINEAEGVALKGAAKNRLGGSCISAISWLDDAPKCAASSCCALHPAQHAYSFQRRVTVPAGLYGTWLKDVPW